MPLAGFNPLSINLDKPEIFDATVHGTDGVPTLRDGGDLSITTKDNATESGRALVCLAFSVEVDGKLMRAQTVTSVRLLVGALHALLGRYGHDGRPQLSTPEALALDATKGMTPEHQAALKEGMLKIAVHRLGGRISIGQADSLLEAQLGLRIGFDAQTLGFNIETRRER